MGLARGVPFHDEDSVYISWAGKSLGDSFLNLERPGIHRSGIVHREHPGRSNHSDAYRAWVEPPRNIGMPVHDGKAYYIKVSAQADGSFTVTNQRNMFRKTYGARSTV